MIKLIAIEHKQGASLLLRFSDGAWGAYDFSRYLDANTEMTAPLRDPDFFARCFIEAGALAWPNGFDLSAESLHRRLRDDGKLHYDANWSNSEREILTVAARHILGAALAFSLATWAVVGHCCEGTITDPYTGYWITYAADDSNCQFVGGGGPTSLQMTDSVVALSGVNSPPACNASSPCAPTMCGGGFVAYISVTLIDGTALSFGGCSAFTIYGTDSMVVPEKNLDEIFGLVAGGFE